MTDAPFALRRLGLIAQPDSARPEEALGILNPAATRGPDGDLYLFPRLVATGNYSRIGRARVVFNHAGDPMGIERLGYALEPQEPYELRPGGGGGCEDPRVTWIEPLGFYAMTYVAYGPAGARVAVAVSDDLRSWRRLGLVDFAIEPAEGVDFNAYRNKDASFFPRPAPGPDGRESLALLHRPMYDGKPRPTGEADPRQGIWISYCALDDVRRDTRALARVHGHRVLAEPEYAWEEEWVGGGAPPIPTPLGWLLIYHGVKKRPPRAPRERKPVVYSAGAMLLDERDPCHVLYRSPEPILEPATPYELDGVAPDAVFPSGTDDRGDGRIDVYYGMADQRIGAARLHLPERLP